MDEFNVVEAIQEFGKGLTKAGKSETPVEFTLTLPEMSAAEFREFVRQVNEMFDRRVQ